MEIQRKWQGEVQGAEAVGLKYVPTTLGQHHFCMLDTINDFGVLYIHQRKFEKAEWMFLNTLQDSLDCKNSQELRLTAICSGASR